MNTFTKVYRSAVDHLTKLLGALGAGLMSIFAFIDPASLRSNAALYLGEHAAEKMGAALFALVIIRGFYTGWKAKQPAPAVQAAATPQDPKAS